MTTTKFEFEDESGRKWRFCGRKLYIKWGSKTAPNMVIALEKIPEGCHEAEFELYGTPLMLCDLYRNSLGETREISIGAPLDSRDGFTIEHFLIDNACWSTSEEEISDALKKK